MENLSLSWKPDFVDVSSSGDLSYTYGKHFYKIEDSLGQETIHGGIYITFGINSPMAHGHLCGTMRAFLQFLAFIWQGIH